MQSGTVLFRETTAVIAIVCLLFLILQSHSMTITCAFCCFLYMKTSNNQNRIYLESAFVDLDPRFSLLCQVGDDIISPTKSAGGARFMSQDPFIHRNQGWSSQ